MVSSTVTLIVSRVQSFSSITQDGEDAKRKWPYCFIADAIYSKTPQNFNRDS